MPAVALLCLLLGGCAGSPAAGSSDAAGAVPAKVHAASVEGVRIAQRVTAPAGVVPDVVGREVDEARRVLLQAQVRVLAFAEQGPVRHQHPPAGAPWPEDGRVVLWVGEPPTAAEVDADADAAAEAAVAAAAAEAATAIVADPAAAVEPQQPASAGVRTRPEAAAPAALPVLAGPEPSPAAPPRPPAPRRTNPRRLPPAAPGTLLTGSASFYGAELAGRPTACGGAFDPAAYTLATRELRCGTIVLVTGPRGSVTATATDFGPAEWTRRRFDLSAATFAAVADPRAGVVDVTVLVLTP